jgi:polysaccharide export outer membrane protein
MRAVFLSFLVLLLSMTSVSLLAGQVLEPPKPLSPLYIVQPNDLLTIFVYKEPTLTGKVLVRPDGRISFPLVQDIQAAGLNPEQLKATIEQSLKQYMDVPNVTVIVDTIQSYRVFVVGKVGKPGMIVFEKPISVLQALSLAGSFLEFAKPAEIVVIRGSGEDSNLYKVNYPDLIKGINFSQNMLLKSGDVVIVP